MLKYVLFDLDGTLLPMDQETFLNAYLKGLATKMAERGYNPDELIKTIWAGTSAMLKNDGSKLNEEVFWLTARKIHGDKIIKDIPYFDEFYKNEFQDVQKVCGFNPKSKKLIELVKSKGLIPVLATTPVFPSVATFSRIKWAGLEKFDFKLITTYENSTFCKPNENYYLQILQKIGAKPEDCLMVGNDVGEDMIATEKLGMQVFLLTDDLINKTERNVSDFPNGNFDDLLKFLGWTEQL